MLPMGNLPRLGAEGAELAAAALPAVPASHAVPTQRPPGAGAPAPVDVGLKGFPAAAAGPGRGKERECGPSCSAARAASPEGSMGLSLGSGPLQAGGTRPAEPGSPSAQGLVPRARCRAWLPECLCAGAVCGAGEAAGLHNCSHSWSGVLSSVWVALLHQHLLPHVFFLAFPGKLTVNRT